jgi:zona occludens toxin (predicted ATPase)
VLEEAPVEERVRPRQVTVLPMPRERSRIQRATVWQASGDEWTLTDQHYPVRQLMRDERVTRALSRGVPAEVVATVTDLPVSVRARARRPLTTPTPEASSGGAYPRVDGLGGRG